MNLHFLHPYGENITNIIVDKVMDNLELDEIDDEYDEDDSEGSFYAVELLCEDIFKGTPVEDKIIDYIESNGYEYNPPDEYTDTEWAGNLYIRMNIKFEWDEKKLTVSYYNVYFYLLECNTQDECDVPDDFTYYIEDVLEKFKFTLFERSRHCYCLDEKKCKQCNGTKKIIL